MRNAGLHKDKTNELDIICYILLFFIRISIHMLSTVLWNSISKQAVKHWTWALGNSIETCNKQTVKTRFTDLIEKQLTTSDSP